MARQNNAYYTQPGEDFQYATADTDPFDAGDVQKLAKAVEEHDHSAGRGRPVARLRSGPSTGVPAAGQVGQVYLNSDTRQFLIDDGTALQPVPFANGTLQGNLNADLVDGQHLSDLDARFVNVTGDTISGNLTITGGLSARPYVFDVWPDANNLTIRPPGAGYLNITSPRNIELFTNAYKAGDGNWYRFDTTKGGFAVRLLADYRLVLQTFGAGTGAITPTGILTLFPSGGVYIGSSPSDPGEGNLRVEEQIIATRVGIGLASPAYPLDVAGDVRWSGTLQGGTVPPARISPQGPGSGLDADMVDGQHAAAFALAGHTHPGVVRAVNNAAGPFTQRDIWQDLVTVTITPGAASGVFLVIGNTYFTGDDPIKLKLVVGAAATPDNAYVYNGYGGKTAWAIGAFTNNTTSPVTVKFQGMIVGGTGTDQFEQSFLTVLWLP